MIILHLGRHPYYHREHLKESKTGDFREHPYTTQKPQYFPNDFELEVPTIKHSKILLALNDWYLNRIMVEVLSGLTLGDLSIVWSRVKVKTSGKQIWNQRGTF